MSKKYPKSDSVSPNSAPENAYVAWGDDLASKQQALDQSSESLEEFTYSIPCRTTLNA